MLDSDLAMLYETETRTLKQAVRRNIDRFPSDFMFQLSRQELNNLTSQIVISSDKDINESERTVHGGLRHLPFAFTEHGVAMLSSVLKSKKAIEVNIAIIRTFIQLRKIANIHKELFDRIGNLESGFESLKEFVRSLLIQENKPKRKIGFTAYDE